MKARASESTLVPASILARKGSRTTAGVPPDVRSLLDRGLIETVNLCEWLIVDQARLAEAVFPRLGLAGGLPTLRRELAALAVPTAPKRMNLIGRHLREHLGDRAGLDRAWPQLVGHRSDLVRAWAAYLVGLSSELSLAAKLQRIQILAADSNLSVREIAWLALRPELARELPKAIRLLTPWAREANPNLRRFGSEATRPRGVWCAHLTALKDEPAQALPILEPLKSDPSLYVRNSVANWLNDASKSQPAWVREVCERWAQESATPETAYIVRRSLRTLRK